MTEHVVGWSTSFAAGLADPGGQAPPGPTSVDGDAATAVRAAAERIDAGLAAGAAGRPLLLGEQGMPGDMALSMILWEYQVHGWDLAAALGRDWAPEPEGLEASLAFAPAMLTPEFQGPDKPFAPRVPVADDAPAMDRLVALSGRDPLWAPDTTRATYLHVASMRALPGRRDDLVGLLGAGPVDTAGCTAYVVAVDPTDSDLVWVSETWLSRRHHAASLRLPAVAASIEKAMPLLTGEFSGHELDIRLP